ncbi:tetratricopeptide repeat protein [Vibrio quintilis]|uniref:Uncharacterized protein n=1 Tax=Vibrio quintilis TaxID=1117707 RepID=A0A1M7YV43_9VIBR|nr:hypothetical protein [Vibrio quintilis]SHO56529.1 hypothetical protein VQ7734_02298 [Vibrio quintilis]
MPDCFNVRVLLKDIFTIITVTNSAAKSCLAKKMVLLGCVALMAGCASNEKPAINSLPADLHRQEKILVAAKNYKALIDFYQSRLRQGDSAVYREKLAKTYLDSHDPESALFTLRPLFGQEQAAQQNDPHYDFGRPFDNISAPARLIAGSACLDLGRTDRAKKLLMSVLHEAVDDAQPPPERGETANLLGIIYAREGNYTQARQMFVLARRYFYDDVAVKNNLALVDMLEGKDEQALQRLMTITESEQNDPQLRANLLLAMAKNGRLDYLRTHLRPSLTDSQIRMIYQALLQAEVAHRPSVGTQPKNIQTESGTGGGDEKPTAPAY